MSFLKNILLIGLQGVWIIGLAPLLTGVIQKTKARLQGRQGPRLLQPYYDLIKHMHKEAVFSKYRSWLTIAVPYLVFIVTVGAGLLIPIIGDGFGLHGDVLIFIYLLAMARFFTALAALDTGSSFGGMGASREMALNTVIEPAFILALLAIVLQTGTTNFGEILLNLPGSGFYVTLPYVLTLGAMLLVILGETGKIPVDNVDTHLELTMIHEGMVLEYSGRYLGLMSLSSMVKQFILVSLFVIFFLPFAQPEVVGLWSGFLSLVWITIKVFIVGIVIAGIEMFYAKLRLYQVPKLFVTSMTLSSLAIIVHLLF